MSSYFDRMSRCVTEPREVVSLVRDQYRWYLRDIADECLVKERERLYELQADFDRIKEAEAGQRNPLWELQMMHDFAHKLGSARIQLRGGRFAGDNPPIPY